MKDKFTKATEIPGLAISAKDEAPKIGAGSGGISSQPFPEIIVKI